jgi:hypothetical protein
VPPFETQSTRLLQTSLNHASEHASKRLCLPRGTFEAVSLLIPPGVTLSGQGVQRTVIRAAERWKPVFEQENTDGWQIEGLSIVGNDSSSQRENTSYGIRVNGSRGFKIQNLEASGFSEAAVLIQDTRPGETGIFEGGLIDGVTLHDNGTGLILGRQAEYVVAHNVTVSRNKVGILINGGNNRVTNSSIITNQDGFIIQDITNGSHGLISNSMINHNERFAFQFKGVRNGMLVQGNNVFYGTISIDDSSQGVQLLGNIISSNIEVAGTLPNSVINNVLVNDGEPRRVFSPGTRVEGNIVIK